MVSFVFDVVGWISAFLDALFLFIARGNPDFTAAMVVASCLLLIVVCHDALVLGKRPGIKRATRIVGVALAVYAVALHLGTRVITLNNAKIQPGKGHASRLSLPQGRADELVASNWLMISTKSSLSPQRWLLTDLRMKRVESVGRVEREGNGRYALRGKAIYFSTPDGSDPVRAETKFRLVLESLWFVVFRLAMGLLYLVAAIVILTRRVMPWLRRAGVGLMRERTLLAALCGFAVFFACHQWRFMSQDARMQRITSRFDDGYMLERLAAAASLKTMDPATLDNDAYGAIGFYPYALLPYVAGHLGIQPSVEALNLNVRGLKLLVSMALLAATWLLGARHFGRVPAITALLLVATNLGFLGYSSYPFYPDVTMAMFSTLSLCFLLDLTSRWNARSFLLSVVCAAMSVSIKFLTFLLFPFIFIVGAVALWREHHGRRGDFFRALFRFFGIAAVLCVAVFFLCNPYLDYNLEWIVPNYKLSGSYYSAETPIFVPGAAASLSTWLNACYRAAPDTTDLVGGALSLAVASFVVIRLLGACVAGRRPMWRWPGGVWSGAGVLLLFGFVFQAYLMKSVTLAESIDQRFVLPLYPLIGVTAAWGVVRLAIAASPAAHPARLLVWVAVTLGVAFVTVPRIRNAADFFRAFGRRPPTSPVSEWLAAADVPPNVWIVNGLRSYIPAKWDNLRDGVWLPKAIDQAVHRSSALPAVYVEDGSSFDANFSAAAEKRGFNTPEQKAMHEEGGVFYADLHRNAMTPFILFQQGEEFVGTNAIHHTPASFRIYANPLSFSVNLADQASVSLVNSAGDQMVPALPINETGAFSLRWPSPVTVGTLHVVTVRKACPDVLARLEMADGRIETLPVRGLGKGDPEVTQHLLQIDTPRDIRAVSLVSADGTPYAASLVADVNVHPPVPFGLNATGRWFDVEGDAGKDAGLDALIALRPTSQPGVEVSPGKPLRFVLRRKTQCDVVSMWIVFDAAPAGSCSARCAYVLADGSRHEMDGVESRSLSPPHIYFRFDCPVGGDVERSECSVMSTTSARLRQINVNANPRAEEAAQ